MVKRHLLRRSAPRTWAVKRKELNWITRPHPGAHKLENCMPINVLLKEILHHAKTSVEAKKILEDGNVLVNKKVIKDLKTPVGFMDTLEIPKVKASYRMVFNTKGKLTLINIPAEETGIKLSKILDIKTIKNKKIQLNLSDGTNLQYDKTEHKTGDTLVLALPDRKVKSCIKLEKGAIVYLTGGHNIGSIGAVESIKDGTSKQKSMITIKGKNGTFETRKVYAFAIGKGKSSISLE